MRPCPNLSLLLPLFFAVSILSPTTVRSVGVNWGTAASHPLPPPTVVELLKSNNITRVKLLDADPLVLQSLAGSNIYVTVGIPNSMLRSLNSSRKAAESWVHENLTRYFSDGAGGVRIEYIAVGDEPFLQTYGDQFYPFVVGAAINIQAALTKAKLPENVKVVVPCSSDAFLSNSGLPSGGRFRPDLNRTMLELLTFLERHRSPFFVTISPFSSYHQNKNKNITLNFALFRETARPIKDGQKTYKNSFDLSYNTLVTALSFSGFPRTGIVVGKIGWPTDGAPNATSSNAEKFMNGLSDHLRTKTPATPIEIYLFTLLDEDLRNISTGSFERHWGIFTFDGQAKYRFSFGKGLGQPVNAQGVDYFLSRWCVVNNNRDLTGAVARASDACSVADCSAMSLGGSCFNLSWPGNLSYAFNSYYQQHNQMPESCDFGGLGLITTVNPSVGSCRFLVELNISLASTLWPSYVVNWLIFLVVTIFV